MTLYITNRKGHVFKVKIDREDWPRIKRHKWYVKVQTLKSGAEYKWAVSSAPGGKKVDNYINRRGNYE